MKKIIFLGLGLIVATVLIAVQLSKTQTASAYEYLRIHIRANSNSQDDQDVKFKVKEKLVDFLIPFLSECDSKDKAMNMLNEKIPEIEKVCYQELLKNGFDYKVKALLKKEEFPARVYDDLTLDAGVYDALIIEIGNALGDNWWCVVFPPFCFIDVTYTGGNSVKYKSKLLEIINNFKKK